MSTLQNTLSLSTVSLGELQVVETVSKCLDSKLDQLSGKRIVFNYDERKMVPIDGWGLKSNPYTSMRINTIEPVKRNTLIAAVDSSSIKVAETDEGSLYAVKCGIATAFAGQPLMHFKIGPMLFYLNDKILQDSELEDRLAKIVLLEDDLAKRLIRVRAERAVQKELAHHFNDAIILVDGSLKISMFEDKQMGMTKIAEECVLRRNKIIGISKATKIKILERVAAPIAKVPGPAYVDVDVIIKSLIRNTFGRNTMVKLEKNSPVLRADIVGDIIESLGLLLGNDPVAGGYPETLRLAHHISTFTSTEITCLRSHVLNNYDVTELVADDIRSILLGSITV